MSEIQYINENIYCVNANIETNITHNNIKPINHILLIDNVHIKKELKTIIMNYAFIIERYMRTGNVNKLYLITSYPKIKVVNVEKTRLYTELNKIINNNSNSIGSEDVYIQMFSECEKIVLDNIDYNEIVMFTNMNHNLSNESMEILKLLSSSDDINVNIICNSDYINIPKINMYLYDDMNNNANNTNNMTMDDFYKTIISNYVFLKGDIIKNDLMIYLSDGMLFGSDITEFKIDTNKYNSFFVNNNIKNIKINDNLINLTETNLNNNNILNAIQCTMHLINNNDISINNVMYQCIKNKLLEFVNNNSNEEIKNKSIFIYQEFKKYLSCLIDAEVNNLNGYNDNSKTIIEYGKKSTFSSSSNRNKICNNRIIKNIKSLNSNDENVMINIQKFIELNENSEDIKFINSCDFFNSSITLSNWFEELQNNNCIGFLVKITSSELAKMGIFDNNISVQNITTSYLPIIDYIGAVTDYFDKNKNIQFGDLNKKNIITGMAIGEANAVIPIYINKYHWEITNQYINPLLGIIV